mgnify:FL=1
MKMISKMLTRLLLLALMLAPAMSASAQGLGDSLSEGKVVFGDNFVLSKGQTLGGDLVVFGGNVTIEEGATVKGSLALFGGNASVAKGAEINGDVALFGGNLKMDGTVNGNLAMMGGDVSLGETALVDGDVSTVGGQINRAEGSKVMGDIVNDVETPTINIPAVPFGPSAPVAPQPNIKVNFNPVWDFLNSVGSAFGMAIILAGLAMLASLFLQPQMERVSGAIVTQPLVAGGFGLLTMVLAPLSLLVLAVTLILSPVAFLGVVVLALAWLFGIIALGHEVGDRLAQSFHLTWSTPLVAGAGPFALVLATNLVGMIPCLGWLAPFLIGLIGLGGVALTVLNSRQLTPVPVAVSTTNEPLPPAS